MPSVHHAYSHGSQSAERNFKFARMRIYNPDPVRAPRCPLSALYYHSGFYRRGNYAHAVEAKGDQLHLFAGRPPCALWPHRSPIPRVQLQVLRECLSPTPLPTAPPTLILSAAPRDRPMRLPPSGGLPTSPPASPSSSKLPLDLASATMAAPDWAHPSSHRTRHSSHLAHARNDAIR